MAVGSSRGLLAGWNQGQPRAALLEGVRFSSGRRRVCEIQLRRHSEPFRSLWSLEQGLESTTFIFPDCCCVVVVVVVAVAIAIVVVVVVVVPSPSPPPPLFGPDGSQSAIVATPAPNELLLQQPLSTASKTPQRGGLLGQAGAPTKSYLVLAVAEGLSGFQLERGESWKLKV